MKLSEARLRSTLKNAAAPEAVAAHSARGRVKPLKMGACLADKIQHACHQGACYQTDDQNAQRQLHFVALAGGASTHVSPALRVNLARMEMLALSAREMGQSALACSAASTKSHSAALGTRAVTSR